MPRREIDRIAGRAGVMKVGLDQGRGAYEILLYEQDGPIEASGIFEGTIKFHQPGPEHRSEAELILDKGERLNVQIDPKAKNPPFAFEVADSDSIAICKKLAGL